MRAQVADAGITIGFAQFLRGGFHHQRVMPETRRRRPADQPRQPQLPSRRIEQIDAANYVRDALQVIVAGRYHDRFDRVEGEWRFTHRRSLTDLTGRMDEHRRE